MRRRWWVRERGGKKKFTWNNDNRNVSWSGTNNVERKTIDKTRLNIASEWVRERKKEKGIYLETVWQKWRHLQWNTDCNLIQFVTLYTVARWECCLSLSPSCRIILCFNLRALVSFVCESSYIRVESYNVSLRLKRKHWYTLVEGFFSLIFAHQMQFFPAPC